MEKRSIVLTVLIAIIVGVITVAVNYGDQAGWIRAALRRPGQDTAVTPAPTAVEPLIDETIALAETATPLPNPTVAAARIETSPSPNPAAAAVQGAQNVQVTAQTGGGGVAVVMALIAIGSGFIGMIYAVKD